MTSNKSDHGPIRWLSPHPDDRPVDFSQAWIGRPSAAEMMRRHIQSAERLIFDALCDARQECDGPASGGCACTGDCLGAALASLRSLTDEALGDTGGEVWWSDQLHGNLRKRDHDTGAHGSVLTRSNYYPAEGQE